MPITSTTKDAQIGKSSVVIGSSFYLGGDAIAIVHDQNPGYLMHLLNSNFFENEKMKHRTGTTVCHLSPTGFLDIKIPIPPIGSAKDCGCFE